MQDFQPSIEAFQTRCRALLEQVQTVIVGQDRAVREVLTCLLAGGHGLLEGVPGVGKTLLVRTLADAARLEFQRIQFTPDLMPADITGTNIFQEDPRSGQRGFTFQPGPIFAHLVLADEINRATPKTQSAVLEAMQERTVSVARTSHPLPEPFVVLATQNPIEMEGTYPLPEAQLDRFLLKIRIDPPSQDELEDILRRTTGCQTHRADAVSSDEDISAMKQTVREVIASEEICRYVARLVRATHPTDAAAPQQVRQYVRYGASPRGAQAMLLAGKVLALLDGRAHVALDDVREAVHPALRHRLILNFDARADGVDPDAILDLLLQEISA